MIIVRYTFLLFSVCVAAEALGQINVKPLIVGQKQVKTSKNVPITIELNDLIVVDVDDVYPTGFTLKLYQGKKFTFQGTTVTPEQNFTGTLTVPVTVNDGQDDSNKFDLKIQVQEAANVSPVITGQQPLSTQAGEKITLELLNLTVVDPDNKYPDDFTLSVMAGINYSVSGQTVMPAQGFVGTLTVPVTVNDGKATSPKFNLIIVVTPKANVPPVISGQRVLSISEDQPITVRLSDLVVTDPDNSYPNGFTLKIAQGNGINYSVSGTTVTPQLNFSGILSVKGVVVNDGKDDSKPYDLQITVNGVNDPPVITGQVALTTFIATPITIEFANLLVTDPDNQYPSGFSLKIAAGFNYKVAGNIITPSKNFLGVLKANVTVDDGSATSNTFELQIRVIPAQNIAPVITGQTSSIVITENRPPSPPNQLTIQLSHLLVTDPDNPNYPAGFTLSVFPGTNYSISGLSITPVANFTGTLSVGVSVNDGTSNSNVFSLQVSVVPISATPQIIGQNQLMINEDESIPIALADLIVTDADDNYPKGFTLQVFPDPDNQYTVNRNTVIPAKNLNGFLTVVVRVKDDDNNPSNAFNLSILINAVNDAPEITQLETTTLLYEPGTDPIALTATLKVEDIDNDHISFAGIKFGNDSYNKGYDELLFTNTNNIRGVFDIASGELSLIGYATLAEYEEAIRSVTYNYILIKDEVGNESEIPQGLKAIHLEVHDGQQASEPRTRNIMMETTVSLDIPTAFSPNGDAANETWNIYALSNANRCENAVVKVYDKRGLLLYQAIGISQKWDGKFNGAILPPDAYYYTIDLKLRYSKKTYSGVVTILR